MKLKQIEELKEQTKILFKVVDKLEQRIATLEKVLDSHAKCIGELRGTDLRIHDLSELTPDEFAKQVRFK
jgi:prefoldin subunit 5